LELSRASSAGVISHISICGIIDGILDCGTFFAQEPARWQALNVQYSIAVSLMHVSDLDPWEALWDASRCTHKK